MKQHNLILELEQLNQLLPEVIRCWRIGNDQQGLQYFTQSIQQIETIINLQLSSSENKKLSKVTELKQIIESLYLFIKNNDLIGITDTIEFQLIPLILQWEEEVRKNGSKK